MALEDRTRRLLRWGVVVAAVVAVVATAALVVTGRPQFCRTCHIMKPRYVSWERSTHSPEADCLDCHAEPGLWGEIKAHVNGARYLYVLVTGREQVILRAEVPEGTCVQCHPEDELPEIAENVAIAHDVHASADVACETCHSGFHNRLQGGTMNAGLDNCTDCHSPSILFGREGGASTQ